MLRNYGWTIIATTIGSRSSTSSRSASAWPRWSAPTSATRPSRRQLPRVRRARADLHRDGHGRDERVHLPDHARLQVAPVLLRHELVAADRPADHGRPGDLRHAAAWCCGVVYYLVMLAVRRGARRPGAPARSSSPCWRGSRSACRCWPTRSIEDDRGQFAIVMRFVLLPMFLFSGTFFPLDPLPLCLQWIGWISPLWHGTELARQFTYGVDRADLADRHPRRVPGRPRRGRVDGRRPHRDAEARQVSRLDRPRRHRPRAGGVSALYAGNSRRRRPPRTDRHEEHELDRRALRILRAGVLPAVDGDRPGRLIGAVRTAPATTSRTPRTSRPRCSPCRR